MGAVQLVFGRTRRCFDLQLPAPKPVSHVAGETVALTTKVALADLSVFSKFDATGPDTCALVDTLGSNRAPKTGLNGFRIL